MIEIAADDSKNFNRTVRMEGSEVALLHATIRPGVSLDMGVRIINPELAKAHDGEIRTAVTEFFKEMRFAADEEGVPTCTISG